MSTSGKQQAEAYSSDHPEEAYELRSYSALGGTQNDEQDMANMGKVQVLNVGFPEIHAICLALRA